MISTKKDFGELSNQDIISMIISATNYRRQKTAFVIAKSFINYNNIIESRIQYSLLALLQEKRIICFGDIASWRFSEISLPPSTIQT